jgi:hypothetical protein
MDLNDKSKTTETVVKILHDQGFRVEKNLKLGEHNYADIVGLRERDNKAILIEIKPYRSVLDQSDVMQVMAYTGSLRSLPDFERRDVRACIVSPAGGTLSANQLAGEFRIRLIAGHKEETLKKDIIDCISASSS